MVSLDVIEREISELEARETSYAVCERLSWLYTVRDHLAGKVEAKVERVPWAGESEFLQLAEGVDVAALLSIMDQHMEALKVVFPKEYEAVMAKVRSLR